MHTDDPSQASIPCEADDQPLDPTLQFPRDTYRLIVHTLRGLLPPAVTGTPEDLARRDNAAIAHLASLLPANADEAHLAAQYVAADAYAMDCLRLARDCQGDATLFLKCNAQSASMMREARATRTLLQRVQVERRKLAADSAAADRAAWTEHCAIGLMTDALTGATPMALPDPPPPQPAVEPAPPEEPRTDLIAEAEQYAAIYPERAALIRGLGRVPDNVSFGPPDDTLVRVLVSGNSPALLALDRLPAEAHAT